MTRKWKDSRGLSLVETLCAVAILVLLGLLINTGLQLAVHSYQDVTAQEELELLAASLSDALADDLRYAKFLKTDAGGSLLRYHSERYNERYDDVSYTVLSIGKDGDQEKDKGQLYANDYRVLPSGAYGNGAYVIGKNDGTSGLEITYDKATGLFTVDLTVKQAEGELSAHTQFTVRCLNPHTAT